MSALKFTIGVVMMIAPIMLCLSIHTHPKDDLAMAQCTIFFTALALIFAWGFRIMIDNL